MNARAIHRHLRRAIGRGLRDVTVTLRPSTRWAAGIPVWTPGPDWTEIRAGTVWTRPRPDGTTGVTTVYWRPDRWAITTGVVLTSDVPVVYDKPGRLRSWALDTVSCEFIEVDSPPVRYQDALALWEDRISDTLRPLWSATRIDLQRDERGWLAVIRVSPDSLDPIMMSGALNRVATQLGATRLRVGG